MGGWAAFLGAVGRCEGKVRKSRQAKSKLPRSKSKKLAKSKLAKSKNKKLAKSTARAPARPGAVVRKMSPGGRTHCLDLACVRALTHERNETISRCVVLRPPNLRFVTEITYKIDDL